MSITISLTLAQFGSALGHAAASAYERGQSATSTGFDQLEAQLTETQAMNADIQKALEDLKTRVQANGSVEASAADAIKGIAQQLRDLAASNDPLAVVQAVKDLSTAVDQQASTLAKAVTDNTPAGTPAATGSGGGAGTVDNTQTAPGTPNDAGGATTPDPNAPPAGTGTAL